MPVKHTPGPWVWEVSTHHKDVTLESRASMHPIVMSFVRWGTGSAAPMFRDQEHDIMRRVEHFAVQRKPHHVGFDQCINHPDAILIAAAPDLLEALMELHKLMDFDEPIMPGECHHYRDPAAINAAMKKARAAIAKAKGE